VQITIKLMASLRARLPPGSQGGKARLDLDAGVTVTSVLERLGIPGGHVHLVMVNGEMEPDRERALADGDELTVFPPVAGG
jgi:molybdopterin converting factor small subunit